MLWVLVAVAVVELTVVHLLLALWQPVVAGVVSLLSLAVVGWLVAGIASFRRSPVLLDRDTLIMRVGPLRRIAVPVANIAVVSGERSRSDLRAMRAVNFALVAHPNVVVTLAPRLRRGRRTIGALAHRLDDAPAFLRALDAIGADG